MLVLPHKKAVIIKPREPAHVMAVLPTAKPVSIKGQTLLAVPHRLDEMRVLINMGYKVPSPIRYHYKWAGRYTPFKAQLETAEFLSLHPRAYLLNDMGTGKTMSTLWAFDYLRSIGKVNKLLVVCPLSTMERTWADEVFNHFPHLTVAVLHGTAKRRKALLDNDADVYVVNHDGLRIIADQLAERPDIDLVVPDEIAQAARNKRTDRWEYLNLVINKQVDGKRWAWGLTGTPTPNDPTDAWAQCLLITPKTVPAYFGKFKDKVMRQVSNFLWVPRENATEVVHKAMQPSIRFTRAECVDLPECVFQSRTVSMSSSQTKHYAEMMGRLKTEVQGGEVLAVNEAVKTNKLVQIACGVVYDTDGNEVFTGATDRINVCDEIINEAEGKVIIFAPFVSVVKHVADQLRAKGHSVDCIYGEVSKHERDRIFGEFQKGSTLRVLVAQPAAMSHGLTLTAANTIIWYAPTFSNDIYEQACARITRPGQTMAQLIVNIEGSPVERRMYERLARKQKMQGLLLSLVEDDRIGVNT